MRVSVVLCTYLPDRYEHFQEAAESVLNQTHPDVELVIVVDGHDELCRTVRDDYGDRDEVVVQCNEENRGLLESRNVGADIANGEIVAFIDSDAVAMDDWVEELIVAYQEQDAWAVGGKMVPDWVDGRPSYLPEEFYWLVGVTHRGFAEGPGEVRNTNGSNISFRRSVFWGLSGFDPTIGGRKGGRNLQGGETELCARLREEYGSGVWYNPDAKVAHKVFAYRTELRWLLDRAFWQGYSKRGMEVLVSESTGEEDEFLRRLLLEFIPFRLRGLLRHPSLAAASQLGMLLILTAAVGVGYLYGYVKW